MDLLELLYPEEDRPQHAQRWKILREEWEDLNPNTTVAEIMNPRLKGRQNQKGQKTTDENASGISFLPGLAGQYVPVYHKEDRELHEICAQLNTIQKSQLRFALKIARQCMADLTELAEYLYVTEMERKDSDMVHLAICDDPECETIVCRKAHGLPPLSEEELSISRDRLRKRTQELIEQTEGMSPGMRRSYIKQKRRNNNGTT